VYVIVRQQFAAALGPALDLALVGFLPPGISVLLVLGGMGVGCAGGFVAARHVR
jgi:hypothetical protein